MGIVLANQKDIRVHHVLEFKEHLGILLISLLFIVLGSRLHLQDLIAVGPRGLLFLGVLILVIRPAAVFASTVGTSLSTARPSVSGVSWRRAGSWPPPWLPSSHSNSHRSPVRTRPARRTLYR